MPKVSSQRNFRRYLSVLYFSMPLLSCTPVMASLDRLFKLWLAGHFQMKFTFDNRTFLTCSPSVNVRKKCVLLYLLCMVCRIHNSLHFFSYSSFTFQRQLYQCPILPPPRGFYRHFMTTIECCETLEKHSFLWLQTQRLWILLYTRKAKQYSFKMTTKRVSARDGIRNA